MKKAIFTLKFIAFLPMASFFWILYYQRKDPVFLFMLAASLCYLLLIMVLDIFRQKYVYCDNAAISFNRIEIDELSKEVVKSKEIIAQLSENLDVLKRKYEYIKAEKRELRELHDDITTGYVETMMVLTEIIEARGEFEHGHSRRVMDIACEIGGRMGLSERDMEILKYSSILHDIGKNEVGEAIINKSQKLDTDEESKLKEHPLIAFGMLENVEFLKNSAEVISQHHERYDGHGYPYGLEGEKINKLSRILAIADSFEAMLSDRPYKKAKSMEIAMNELEENKGKQFDPVVAEVLIRMIKETHIDLREELKDENIENVEDYG